MNPNPLKTAYPSTKIQRQLIAIGCAKLGINADLRHEMLNDRFGVDSSTKLTRNQADRFLDELGKRGFTITSKPRVIKKPAAPVKRGGKTVIRMVNQKELDKIHALSGLIEWKYENGLELWIKKRFKIERVKTAKDAWLAIEGLKKMFENHMKSLHGPHWWAMEQSNPDIRIYISEHCPERYR